MNTLVPRKAPELILKLVNDEYGFAVNCSYPNSFRILNKSQFEILLAINNQDNIQSIADRLDIELDTLQKFVILLSKTEIVRLDDNFTIPKKTTQTKSLNFWIHTTNACNLGCSYCYISTLNMGKAMPDTVRQQLINKLVEAVEIDGIKHIKLRLAGGEPLGQFNVWKEFIPQATTLLGDKGCKLEIVFITNLTILNEEIIEFSKRYNLSFGVSLDGVGIIHDTTRQFRSGSGTFSVVDANIRKLLANDITVSVNTVVSNNNIYGLPELTSYLISLNIPFRYSIVKGESINAEFLDTYLNQSHMIMMEAIDNGWQFSRKYQFCDLKPNELGFQTCASGFSGGAIYVDGSFKYCHVQFGSDTNFPKSIFNEELSLLEMIQGGEHLEDEKSEDCKKCKYKSVCTSGCPVYRVEKKDPQCSIYHKFIPTYYELQAKERLKLMRTHAII
jgi:uncharacterized protein